MAFGLTTGISPGPAHGGTSVIGIRFREKIGIREQSEKRPLSGGAKALRRVAGILTSKEADLSGEEAVWVRHAGALHRWMRFTSSVLLK